MASSVPSFPWTFDPFRVRMFACACLVMVAGCVVLHVCLRDKKQRAAGLSRLIIGADGRVSTSKFQAMLWTFIALFALFEITLERFWLGFWTLPVDVPVNLMIAMGFSVTTWTAAKGITVSYVEKGLVDKQPDASGERRGGLFTDDDGEPDLGKIQMTAFTLIAFLIYLFRLCAQQSSPPEMADIESSSMVLMGLSQGAYLGKKLTTIDTPRITGMLPPAALPGSEVTLTGINLGGSTSGARVLLADTPCSIGQHSDAQLKFVVPMTQSNGKEWTNAPVSVTLISSGRETISPTSLQISPAIPETNTIPVKV